MSISILAPLLYLSIGLLLGKTSFNIKEQASALLTKWVIPAVIVYNIATHRPGVFIIMLGIITMMMVMLLLSRRFTKDPVSNLCFCYLNIGWLGLPIASSLFGNEAAMVIIAAYVGSSLFGNSIGVGLMAHDQTMKNRFIQTLKAPPAWSLMLGLACIPFGEQIEHHTKQIYDLLKFLMSFLGMGILGIWLSETSLKMSDFKKALIPFVARALTVSILSSLLIFFGELNSIDIITANKATLHLIGFLPPAANIIVLETHYMRSGRSASMIACGTCISLVAIGAYIGFVTWLNP